jgi:thiol-disulfide isomerase/thioredoxin
MLKKYEGKIVYLDIWSLGCAPCIENMPKSKKIKANLQNRPIEFVYITTDIMFSNVWDKVYDVTLIKENHYRFAKGFDARMLKYLEINWVPNYMLFNKNGDLLSYTAVRPDDPNCEKELLKFLN